MAPLLEGTMLGEIIGVGVEAKNISKAASTLEKSAATEVKEISPNVKKVLNTIDDIKKDGGKIQVNKLKAEDKQELNMTFQNSDKSKLDLRVETHKLKTNVGGNGNTSQRHLNADVTNSSGNPVKMKHINGGHKILE